MSTKREGRGHHHHFISLYFYPPQADHMNGLVGLFFYAGGLAQQVHYSIIIFYQYLLLLVSVAVAIAPICFHCHKHHDHHLIELGTLSHMLKTKQTSPHNTRRHFPCPMDYIPPNNIREHYLGQLYWAGYASIVPGGTSEYPGRLPPATKGPNPTPLGGCSLTSKSQ